MGCGASKPATAGEAQAPQAQPAAAPNSAAKPPLPKQNASAGSKNESSTTDTTADTYQPSSSETTPVIKRAGSRGLDARVRGSNNRKLNRGESKKAPVVLQGPPRDYTGLPLDNRRNDRYSHITKLASAIMKASCCFVILGQEERMLLVNSEGLQDGDDPWLPQFCAWALGQASGLLAIEDMSANDSTKNLPWVCEPPDVNFYAGASLHNAKGERVGVLCVLDFEAKPGSTILCQSLPKLGEMVMKELAAGQQADASENLLYKAMDTYWDGSVLVDCNQGGWLIKYANESFGNMTGINRDKAQGRYLWDLVEAVGTATTATADPWKRYEERVKAADEFHISPVAPIAGSSLNSSNNSEARVPHSRPSMTKKFKIHMRPQTVAALENHGLDVCDAALKGIYYAVFSPLVDMSMSSLTTLAQRVDELVPFEGVEMGPMIGKGSFGSVFKATWNQRMVAIKVIESADIAKVDASGNPLEASLMLGMKHPNVVETIQYSTQQAPSTDEGNPSPHESGNGSNSSAPSRPGVIESWLMLEFCDIGTLSDGLMMGLFHEVFVPEPGKEELVPKIPVILQTARDIARGLNHIHKHNILHGDLTAGNILLTWSNPDQSNVQTFTAKIADFGLSRQAITSKVETNTYGTVTHMPPELLNEGILSKAADVYAYGVLLYEIFTRKTVWEGLRHPQIIHAIAVMKKHPELPDNAPQAYKELADACMSGEPEDRPNFESIIESLDLMITKHVDHIPVAKP